MFEPPERIWLHPGVAAFSDEAEPGKVAYIRADIVAAMFEQASEELLSLSDIIEMANEARIRDNL